MLPLLQRMADSLDRLAPAKAEGDRPGDRRRLCLAPEASWLQPVAAVSRVHINLLQGIDRNKDILLDNTRRFARGLPANNALLWGARGTGKSSLVKAVHAAINLGSGNAPEADRDPPRRSRDPARAC